VRLEVASECPQDMAISCCTEFELSENDHLQLQRAGQPDPPDGGAGSGRAAGSQVPPFTPGRPLRLARNADMFDVIRRGDVLLHHPFQSFAPVVDFLRQAARDPDVLVIKQTLYRTGPTRPSSGAGRGGPRGQGSDRGHRAQGPFRRGGQHRAGHTDLQEAGAHVVYGIVGHKTHAKMILVVRREGKQLRRYVHLGTGNYHARTARQYTDYGLFTCDNTIGVDVQKIFQQLTAPAGRAGKLKKLLQAPFTMHKSHRLIDREAACARRARARASSPR
jgi:polyphosphate kinase